MENGKIRPLADPKPLNQSTQNLKQVITSTRRPPVQNFMQIHPLGTSWQIGEMQLKFFCIKYTFLMAYLQIRLPGGFSRTMVPTTRPHARVKLFRELKFKVNI